MELPIKFPSDDEVIAEDAAHFRALSPEERIRVIEDLLAAGALIMRNSPNAEFLHKYKEEQEELGKQRIKEFIARHTTAKS